MCEYVGEILTDTDADRRDDDSFLFDLGSKVKTRFNINFIGINLYQRSTSVTMVSYFNSCHHYVILITIWVEFQFRLMIFLTHFFNYFLGD